MMRESINRRELFSGILAAASLSAAPALPATPVAIARCPSYAEDQTALLSDLFDKLGGLDRLVKGKTVTVKVNLTGAPALKFQGKPLGVTHYTHPKQIGAFAFLAHRAGARRIRFVESAWGTAGPLSEYMLDAGWNVRQLLAAAPGIEFVNTNGIGPYKEYAEFGVPGGGLIFPSYRLNKVYRETDVLVSMAKLKNHATCGVTLAMKNIFGITPASIYGDDAGVDEPNESPTKGRVNTCHFGKRQPAKIAAPEKDPSSSRESFDRMPRITAELNAACPVGISIIDGIETVTGGEGPWIRGLKYVNPGVMIVGTNAVCTDAVATAVMGYDPLAPRGQGAFVKCENQFRLAGQLGIGTADLNRIEVRGVPVTDAMFRFPA